MIRLLCVLLLTFVALIGLSLRVSREAGDLSEPVRRAVAQVTTLDLGSALPSVPAEQILAALSEGERGDAAPPRVGIPEVDAPPVEQEIAATRFAPFVEAAPSGPESVSEPELHDGSAVAAAAEPTVEIDQEAWADLIRRMLAVYPRSGSDR